MASRKLGTLLSWILLAACPTPTGPVLGARCGADLPCAESYACYRSFCVEAPRSQVDGGNAPSIDASMQDGVAANDAAVTPRPTADANVMVRDATAGEPQVEASVNASRDAATVASRDASGASEPRDAAVIPQDAGAEDAGSTPAVDASVDAGVGVPACVPFKCCKKHDDECWAQCLDLLDPRCWRGDCKDKTCRGKS